MNRAARIGGGTALIIVGIPMLVLPGPGLLSIAAGLALLGTEYDWAKRILDRAKPKLKQEPRADRESA